MKILYTNACVFAPIKGHKAFDIEMASALSEIAEVDLLEYAENWYENVPNHIRVLYFDPDSCITYKKVLNSKWLTCGLSKHLGIYQHIFAKKILDYINTLDKNENYDSIIISVLDTITFAYTHKNYNWIRKLYTIEFSTTTYQKRTRIHWFNMYKNKIHHIIMEKPALEYYQNELGIMSDKVIYIPHPLPVVRAENIVSEIRYDIVGISNSTSEELIKKIVEYEERTHFFEKYRIKVLLKTKCYEYESPWLKVISGKEILPQDEYYAYITNAKIILLPYDFNYGFRSSGALSDAFAYKIPVIGSAFDSLKVYAEEFPHICKTFVSLDQMCELILQTLNANNNDIYKEEFERFINDRSKKSIIKYLEVLDNKRNNI